LKRKSSLQNRLVFVAALLLASCGGGVANNPSPTVTSTTPPSVPAGSPGFVLTVNGHGFAPQSVIDKLKHAAATENPDPAEA